MVRAGCENTYRLPAAIELGTLPVMAALADRRVPGQQPAERVAEGCVELPASGRPQRHGAGARGS